MMRRCSLPPSLSWPGDPQCGASRPSLSGCGCGVGGGGVLYVPLGRGSAAVESATTHAQGGKQSRVPPTRVTAPARGKPDGTPCLRAAQVVAARGTRASAGRVAAARRPASRSTSPDLGPRRSPPAASAPERRGPSAEAGAAQAAWALHPRGANQHRAAAGASISSVSSEQAPSAPPHSSPFAALGFTSFSASGADSILGAC